MTVLKLATSQPAVPKRACSTCRHSLGERCRATGVHQSTQRLFTEGACGMDGNLWEPKPEPKPWPGLLPTIRNFLFGRPL